MNVALPMETRRSTMNAAQPNGMWHSLMDTALPMNAAQPDERGTA